MYKQVASYINTNHAKLIIRLFIDLNWLRHIYFNKAITDPQIINYFIYGFNNSFYLFSLVDAGIEVSSIQRRIRGI